MKVLLNKRWRKAEPWSVHKDGDMVNLHVIAAGMAHNGEWMEVYIVNDGSERPLIMTEEYMKSNYEVRP